MKNSDRIASRTTAKSRRDVKDLGLAMGLTIVIVGNPNGLRNEGLKALSSAFEVCFSPPVSVKSGDDGEADLTNQSANLLLLGRRLLAGEIGCAAAHLLARRSVRTNWTLVLEDDAVISKESINLALALVRGLDPTVPQIVNLYNPESSNLAKPSLQKLGHSPSSTLAYMSSSAVREIELDIKLQIGTADWPLHLANVNFFQVYGLDVREAEGPSTVDPSRSRKSQAKVERVLGLFRTIKILKSFGFQGVSFAVINPLRRDSYNLAIRFRTSLLGWFSGSAGTSRERV